MTDLPLADLDAFTAVARERSFRAAARRRGVSASSLSEALRRLEERLGVRLLNRTTRSVTLTEAGHRLLQRLAPALSEVTSALEQAAEAADSPSGPLRLNVPTVVAHTIMPQLAAGFLKAFPGVSLEVTADDSFIDVLAAGFDAGVRYDERLEKDMIAIPIGPRFQRFVTAASPAYIEAHGRPAHPRELLDHRCIRHRFASGAVAQWEFEKDGGHHPDLAAGLAAGQYDPHGNHRSDCRRGHHRHLSRFPCPGDIARGVGSAAGRLVP